MSRKLDIDASFQVNIDDLGVADIVFGEVGKMPSTDARDHAAIGEVWSLLAKQPDVRSILVRSIGKGFCAGGSQELTEAMLNESAVRLRVLREARVLVQGMMDCDIPIVSAINGAAVGAGAAVAILADISIAGYRAKIIDGHTKFGVAAGDHAALIWPLLCGMARAKYHLLLCNTIEGQEAERIGLVSLAVPDDQLHAKSREVAEALARGSRSALAYTKRSLNHWLRAAWPAFEHSLALEMVGFSEHGHEVREGLAAVAQRRAPKFI